MAEECSRPVIEVKHVASHAHSKVGEYWRAIKRYRSVSQSNAEAKHMPKLQSLTVRSASWWTHLQNMLRKPLYGP